MNQYIVRFGRTDGTVTKTHFNRRRREALQLANSISYLLWGEHKFKASECREFVRAEQGGFWIEFKSEMQVAA